MWPTENIETSPKRKKRNEEIANAIRKNERKPEPKRRCSLTLLLENFLKRSLMANRREYLMWAVSAYDDESNPLISFQIETESDLQDLLKNILLEYSQKPIRLLEIETLPELKDD